MICPIQSRYISYIRSATAKLIVRPSSDAMVIPFKLTDVKSRVFSYHKRRRSTMKTSKFTVSPIMAIFKQAEPGAPVQELCSEDGMSLATFYKWRLIRRHGHIAHGRAKGA